MNNHFEFLSEHLTEREKLEMIAEESTELAHAALKVIRARGLSNNPTPISDVSATYEMTEEFVDVIVSMLLYGVDVDYLVNKAKKSPKLKRGADRIREMLERKKRLGVRNGAK